MPDRVDLNQIAEDLENIARGVGIPDHRKALEDAARQLRGLDPSAPEDPVLVFRQVLAEAEAADPRTPTYATAWQRAQAYGIQAAIAAFGRPRLLIPEQEAEGHDYRAPFPVTSPEAPAFPATLKGDDWPANIPEEVRGLSVYQLAAVVRADTAAFPDAGKVVVPDAIAEIRARAESPASADREDARAALAELAAAAKARKEEAGPDA